MPQKKNPDSLELLRGKSGRIFGNVCFSVSCHCLLLIYLLDGGIHDVS